jgi:spore germination protein KB
MPEHGRISSVQLFLLLYITEISTTFLIIPGVLAKEAGTDSWLVSLVPVTVYGLAVALVCVSLAGRFPNQVFTEYLPRVAGRWPGKILAAAYIFFFVHVAAVILSQGANYIHTAFLRETPLLAIELLLLSVAVYGVYLGIEVIARQNTLVFALFMFSLLLLVTFVLEHFSFKNLLPVLENGMFPVLKASALIISWRGEVFFILMLYPYLNRKQEALRTASGVVVFSGISQSAITLVATGVFGAALLPNMVFSIHELVRYISIGFLERMEVFIVVIWVAGLIVKLAIFIHAASTAAAHTLGLKNYRWFIVPATLAALVLSETIFRTSLQQHEFFTGMGRYYASIFQLLLPGLLLFTAVIRKRRDRAGAEKT